MFYRIKTIIYLTVFSLFLIAAFPVTSYGQACDPSTPSFTFDLSGNPDSVWLSTPVVREGLCCGLDPNAKPPIRCVEFFFTLDTGSVGIRFDIATGAIPPGSLGYQINCGPYHMVGENICLDGPGPHRLTFCKPGANTNTYSITAIAKPKVSNPIYVSDGCQGILTTEGYDPATITWTSVPFNATYNSYLSCTSGCTTTTVTAQPGYPPYVDYQVSGVPMGGCESNIVTNIVRVTFVTDKAAEILPKNPVICFGGTTTSITANGTGGAPPYMYLWNTGETTQSINVGIGFYKVRITDQTNCPPVYDSVWVTANPSPIIANAGPDTTTCANNPSTTLQGSIIMAAGGQWSGGSGTYSPSDTSLNAVYTPTALEITNGQVVHVLTSTGNGGCPVERDTMIQTILPAPIVEAGINQTLCANNSTVNLNGTISNAAGGTWTGGTGTFYPNATTLNAIYYPSASEITAGTVTLTLTSSGNANCNPESDSIIITITPAPIVNAGSDVTVCGNNPNVNLNGSVTVATGGTWVGGGTFSPDATSLTATYTPSAAEITNGSATLILTTTGNGNCSAVSDTILINITPAPTVNAGIDATICTNNLSNNLTGIVTEATGGIWSGGTGTFSPSNTTLNATYTPSAAEITAGTTTLTLTTTGNGLCAAVTDNITLTILPGPIVNAGIDQFVCSNNATVTLNGTVTNATGGEWTGGSGTFSPGSTILNSTYQPSAADISSGFVSLFLTSTGNGACMASRDTMRIFISTAPTANAGSDQTLCANNAAIFLTGSSTNGATSTVWSGGAGSFAPTAATATTTYTPTAGEIASGSLTLTFTANRAGCNPVTDQMVITFTPAPVINAGPDRTVCANNSSVTLNGSVTIASGMIWNGGTGIFSPSNTSSNPIYTPTAAEVTNGSVVLIVTSTGNGNCSAVSDTMTVTITPAPTVNAGTDRTVCANNSSINLTGSVTIATGGIWSGGGGIFTPNATSLTASYIPSDAEKTSGSVTLTLTTTGNGNCNAVTDQMIITITPAPTVNAGSDISICANNPVANLNGTITVATGGTWTGGGGLFTPGRNTLNTTYTPSSNEITSGASVVLTLTTTGNGSCNPVSDNLVITITPAPTVNAGPDQTVCGANTSVTLNGSVTVSGGATWTSTGTGTFSPNANTLNATYIASSADTSAGSVMLTLTTTLNGNCLAVNDNLAINFTDVPSINAGPDQTVCTTSLPVQLNASGSSSTWIGGTGTFTPNRNTLNAVYQPSATEITAGLVNLTISTIANGACAPISDAITLTIPPGPVANAGPDQIICADKNSLSLSGSVSNATSGTWTTSGTGTFSPDANTLNATYLPSITDKSTATVTLTLTTVGNGSCLAATDKMVITITPAVTVNAGPDRTVCGDISGVELNGSVTVASGATWSTSGTGTFTPNSTTLNAQYIPSAADTASGMVILRLTSTGNGNCNTVSEDMILTITPAPTVNAGTDYSVCGDVTDITLSGTFTVATGTLWTTTGTGAFSPSASNQTTKYTLTSTDKTSGKVSFALTTTGNGSCLPKRDSLHITITPVPTINAGPDQTICADAAGVNLSGLVTVATGGQWSTFGSGTFANANSLNTIYTPSQTDIDGGTVTLTLTTTGQGTCLPLTDNIIVTITPAPVINAGADQTVCNNNGINLSGTITVASGGLWTSSGSGSFVPDATSLNAVYMPSNADTSAGSVILTLTSTGNGTCQSVTDDITVIIITPFPNINAGSDKTICSNDFPIQLEGSGDPGTWSGGAGSFLPDATTLNATYMPTATEVAAGTITLRLTTLPNQYCEPIWDEVTFTIPVGPTVNAGMDQTVCSSTSGIQLNGSVTIATGAVWSTTSGSGTFSPSANALNAVFTPTPAQITAGMVVLTLTTTGNGLCTPEQDQMTLFFSPAPTVNAGLNQIVCADASGINLTGSITNTAIGTWTSSGTGTFTPNVNTLNATYNPSAADKIFGTVNLTLTASATAYCPAVTDIISITITPAPTVFAGVSPMCSDATGASLNGSVTIASGGVWTTSGTGVFNPGATSLNTTYMPSAADITAGTVNLILTSTGNGTCQPVKDTISLMIAPTPVVNAGSDQVVCSNNSLATLNGSVVNAPGGTWTSAGGGTLSPNANQLNASYQPSAIDITNGKALLTLTSNPVSTCPQKADQMEVLITPSPTANAGIDQTVCANNSTVNLNGFVTIATGGVWSSSGTGIFSPSNTALNAQYVPSAADIAAGTVTLTLTTTGNGLCNPVSDQMIVTITPSPLVDTGTDQVVCGNVLAIAFFGTVSNATGGIWSTSGSGTFSPNASSLNVYYYPSDADRAAGTVTLTLTSTGNGTCFSVDDDVITDKVGLSFIPAPVADAGPAVMCSDEPNVQLSGAIYNAGGGAWVTSGTGTFSDTSDLNAVYTPSADDIAAGSVLIILSTTINGLCESASDTMVLRIIEGSLVDAGSSQTVCADIDEIQLTGSVAIATGGIWTSSGSGTFSPSDTDLNATYIPSSSDTAAGNVIIQLTTTGNGMCSAVSDTMSISLTPAPTVDAGPATVCSNNAKVTLQGAVTVATGIVWTTSGTGSFSDPLALTTDYDPSNTDKTNGFVYVKITSTGNGTCKAYSDSVRLNITPPPTADAGSDISLCSDVASVNINGSVTIATGGVWTTSGTGTFGDATALSTTYIPSAADTSAGSVTLTLQTTGNGSCLPYTDDLILTLTDAPTINAGTDQTVCSDISGITIQGSMTVATAGAWATSGTGTFDNNTLSNPTYTPTAADTAAGSIMMIYTTNVGLGTCNPVQDTMIVNFTPAPSIDAGPATICMDNTFVPLTANVTVSSGVQWTTSGTGYFTPNDISISTNYVPSAADKTAGSVQLTVTSTGNGTCMAVTDNIMMYITPPPAANAGQDQTICADASSVNLSGSVIGATGGTWTTTGTGSFTPDANSLNAAYIPSAADTANKSVILYLTTTGVGSCTPRTDSILLAITPAPTIYAGTDVNVCNNLSDINITSTVTIASGGMWTTSGTGNFYPSPFELNATYTPSSADSSLASLEFIMTTTGNGTCNPVTDTVIITLIDRPIAIAGADQTICADMASINLSGVSMNAPGTLWTSSGSGSFTPDATTANASYIPSSGDIADGTVIITIATTGSALCPESTDQLALTITPAPTINAGYDRTVCSDVTSVPLNGIVTVATGGVWTTTGSGNFIPNVSTLNASYEPSAADISAGQVYLILTTTGNGSCNAVSDSILLRIDPLPTVNAGPDQNICADRTSINLLGAVTVAQGGAWSTSGTGNFNPNAITLNTAYNLTAADKSGSGIYFTLTSVNGGCATRTDTLNVTFTPVPLVNAGNDITVCADTNSVGLNGSFSLAAGAFWTSTGNGTFIPDSTSLNATYLPSASDKAAGVVNLQLITTGNGSCQPSTDLLSLTITNAPTIFAGNNQTVCADIKQISLTASVTVAGGVSWATSGTGSFTPLSTSLTPSYVLSNADTSAGSILLIATSTGNGSCKAVKDSLEITITPAPTIKAIPANSCAGLEGLPLNGMVTIASGGIWATTGTGTFSPNEFSLNTTYYPSDQDIATGTATFTLTSDGNGTCNAVTDQVTIIIKPLPVADAGTDGIVCRGSDVLLNAQQIEQDVSYSWQTYSGTVISGISQITVIAASDTSFILTATDNKNCSVKDTINISVIDPPTFNLNEYYCFQNNLVLDANPQNIPAVPGTFQWLRNDTLLVSETNTTIIANQIGKHTIIYNYGNCLAFDSTELMPLPLLNGHDKLVCEGGSTTIATNLLNKANYSWQENGSPLAGATNILTVTNINTTRTFVAIVTDSLGCSNYDTIIINTVEPPVLTLNNTPACVGETVILNAQPSNLSIDSAEYTWFKSGILLPDDTTNVLNVINGGLYQVTYRVGECFGYDSSFVNFNPLPTSTADEFVKFCEETQTSVTLNAGAGDSFFWLSSGNQTPSEIVSQPGTYFVRIFNEYNCYITDSIKVIRNCPPRLYLPNAITIGGDPGKNSIDIYGANFKNFKMTIFNRWGEIIFHTEDQSRVWDGYYRGERMPIGVYPYLIYYEGDSEDFRGPFKKEGSITIVE